MYFSHFYTETILGGGWGGAYIHTYYTHPLFLPELLGLVRMVEPEHRGLPQLQQVTLREEERLRHMVVVHEAVPAQGVEHHLVTFDLNTTVLRVDI